VDPYVPDGSGVKVPEGTEMKPLWLEAVPPFFVAKVTGRLHLTELTEPAGEDDDTRRPPQAALSTMRASAMADRVAARITHI
jgi:hypothetical protein